MTNLHILSHFTAKDVTGMNTSNTFILSIGDTSIHIQTIEQFGAIQEQLDKALPFMLRRAIEATKVKRFELHTCDNSFTGTLDECKAWFHSDSFSPKVIDWAKLKQDGRLDIGNPYGVIELIETKTA